MSSTSWPSLVAATHKTNDNDTAPIFASGDIAALVANFQPLALSARRPLLVRSKSGEHLTNLSRATSHLERLISEEPGRIKKSDLTSLLHIEQDADACIYQESTTPWHEDFTHQYLLPRSEVETISEKLNETLGSLGLELNAFAQKNDIALDSLHKLIEREYHQSIRRISSKNREFIISFDLAKSLTSELRDAVSASGSEICDLRATIPEQVPLPVLIELSKDLTDEFDGEISLEGDRVVYVPANHAAAMEERIQKIRGQKVRDLVRQIEDRGYCVVEAERKDLNGRIRNTGQSGENLDQLVLKEFERTHPDISIRTVSSFTSVETKSNGQNPSRRSQILTTSATLEHQFEAMKLTVASQAEESWRSGQRSSALKAITQALQRREYTLPDQNDLAQLLLRSEYASELIPTVKEHIEKLEHAEDEKFSQLVEVRLLIPLQLYHAGVSTIKDATLKQHLEEFMYDHFRKEVIPQMIGIAQEQNLLHDKDRDRQVEKLKSASIETKSFQGLHAEIGKFAKKLKLDTPSSDLVIRVRRRTLQTAVKSMNKMSRGSDVLQNLIWILLSRESGGLFMSSGKDTSRMIKQWQIVGDEETAKKLVHWRDILKAGQESKADLEEMRKLAAKTVEEILDAKDVEAGAE